MPRDRKKTEVKYVYQLPYAIRREICQILDSGQEWKTLAGELDFSNDQIKLWENEFLKPGGSPTDSVLTHWGHSCATIVELYKLLRSINCIRASEKLQHLVAPHCRVDQNATRTKQMTACQNDSQNFSLPGPPLPVRLQTANNYERQGMSGLDRMQDERRRGNLEPVEDLDSWNSSVGKMSTSSSSNQGFQENAWPSEYGAFPTQRQPQPPPRHSATGQNQTPSASGMMGTHIAKDKFLEQKIALESCHAFSYEEIMHASNNFNNSLGSGGFGNVFKGELKSTTVAIKVMKPRPSLQAGGNMLPKHLFSEIQALLRYRHENIISLLGYSTNGPKLCLIYQYMANGSLEDFLACKDWRQPLSWNLRSEILLGAARGINYLHTAASTPLIHADIKSANILLDKHFEAKVSDFGLANQANSGTDNKKTHVSRTDTSAKVYGSKAYLPPEFFRAYHYSLATDVFGFGVVICEVCTGDRAHDDRREGGENLYEYVGNVMETKNTNKILQIRDRQAGGWPDSKWWELISLGAKCIELKKAKRPTMDHVLQSLIKHQASVEEMLKRVMRRANDSPPAQSHEEIVEGQGKGQMAKEGTTDHSRQPYIGVELQKLAEQKFKDPANKEMSFPESDPEKLRLINEHHDNIDYPKPPGVSETVKTEVLASDPAKAKQIEEFDQQQSFVSHKSPEEESVPYMLQQAFDLKNAGQVAPPRRCTAQVPRDEHAVTYTEDYHSVPTTDVSPYGGEPRLEGLDKDGNFDGGQKNPSSTNLDVVVPVGCSETPKHHHYVNVRSENAFHSITMEKQLIAAQLSESAMVPKESEPAPATCHPDCSSQVTECIQNLQNYGIEESYRANDVDQDIVEFRQAQNGIENHGMKTAEIIDHKKAKDFREFVGDALDCIIAEDGNSIGTVDMATHLSSTETKVTPPIYTNCYRK